MKKHIITLFIFFLSIQNALPQLIFEKEEYASRRENLMDCIPDGIAIIRGASMPVGDVHFHQYNNMMYFSGVDIPDVILIIDGINRESTLFFTISERVADGEAIPLTLVRDPVNITGIENYLPIEDFTPVLTQMLKRGAVAYTPFSSEERIAENSGEKFRAIQRSMTQNEWDGRLSREMQFVQKLNEKFPGTKVENCSPDIWDLRKIKSAAEVDVLRKAAQVGVKAHKAVMAASRPGEDEKSLAALFEYTCMSDIAQGLSFNTIIMSAEHHVYGHYAQYDRKLENGDFIILDGGADVNYYDSDVSTTFPANGIFTDKQGEIYEFAYNIREVCQKAYRPGITLADVGLEVKEMLKEKGYDTENPKYRGYFRNGGFNHSIGMAVHDKLDGFSSKNDPLQVGFVFACDIMVRADSVTSVRIEDTVVITADGCEVLSAGLPRTIEEIESFMKQ
ncbi:MAG: aminopeptidase P family protein [Bacteroidetes bacterium]|nr:aminopeptidase P family protein [Bacteroidota bacterium]